MTFSELAAALARAGCETGAAECHATLTGLICAAAPLPADWMARVTGGGDDEQACRRTLTDLESQLRAELSGGQMAFDLLLPDDEEELQLRASALAQWCQGFLYGLTLGGVEAGRPLPDDVAEIVSDFARLAGAGHTGEADEEDEAAYVELCEFVRVGAQLAYEELGSRRAAAAP